MKIALYRGKSLVSLAIRFLTRSKYSHAAFLFDEKATKAAQRLYEGHRRLGRLHYWQVGAVVEAWQGGVKNSLSLSTLHTPGTYVDEFALVEPLGDNAEENLVLFCSSVIGDPYSYLNVMRFLGGVRLFTRPDKSKSWFGSECVFAGFKEVGTVLLNHKHDYEVPPDWLQMSTKLRFCGTAVTK